MMEYTLQDIFFNCNEFQKYSLGAPSTSQNYNFCSDDAFDDHSSLMTDHHELKVRI